MTAAVPRHIAIVMDGNRRWARGRHLPVIAGHRQGVETIRRTVKAARDRGVEYVTLYSFSTENWTRDEEDDRRGERGREDDGGVDEPGDRAPRKVGQRPYRRSRRAYEASA